MAKLKDDPQVQDLMNKSATKAAADATKAAAAAAKGAMDEALSEAEDHEDPAVAKALKRHLGAAKKLVIQAIKG
jgi:hypothetical protein